MVRRLDLYLTRKAAATWEGAQVYAEMDCAKDRYPRRFVLEWPEGLEMDPLILVSSETPARSRFHVAREALGVLRKSVR